MEEDSEPLRYGAARSLGSELADGIGSAELPDGIGSAELADGIGSAEFADGIGSVKLDCSCPPICTLNRGESTPTFFLLPSQGFVGRNSATSPFTVRLHARRCSMGQWLSLTFLLIYH